MIRTSRWRKQFTLLGIAATILVLVGLEVFNHQARWLEALDISLAEVLALCVAAIALGVTFGVRLARRAHLDTARSMGRNPPGARRRVVICADSLLTEGVNRLLTGEGSLDVRRVVPPDEDSLLDAIEQLHPDALVFDQDTPLIQPGRLLELLAAYPTLRIVTVNAAKDRVQIHDRASIDVGSVADLVNILRSDNPHAVQA